MVSTNRLGSEVTQVIDIGERLLGLTENDKAEIIDDLVHETVMDMINIAWSPIYKQ